MPPGIAIYRLRARSAAIVAWRVVTVSRACTRPVPGSRLRRYGQDVTRSTSGLPVKEDLLDAYGIEVRRFRRHPFGFESECWIADDRWFVKVWRHDPPGNLALLEYLDLPVPAPLRTRDGALVATAGTHSYAVYPYVRGRDTTWPTGPRSRTSCAGCTTSTSRALTRRESSWTDRASNCCGLALIIRGSEIVVMRSRAWSIASKLSSSSRAESHGRVCCVTTISSVTIC